MIKWIPCELRTCTLNSGGNMTLIQLAQKAKMEGIDCIVITDNNTIAGHLEISLVMRETGILIVPAMEWTTFHGYMITIGMTHYDERIEVKDWNDIDYIEVWSEAFPLRNSLYLKTFELWTSLLNKGYRLMGVSGRDGHEIDNSDNPIYVTYVGINSNRKVETGKAIISALLSGRVVSSIGPLMFISVQKDNCERRYTVGDEIEIGRRNNQVKFNIVIDYQIRKEKWRLDSKILKIILMSNKGKLMEVEIKEEIVDTVCTLKTEEMIWIRAELYGEISGNNTLIAFTNPIYFVENDYESILHRVMN